MKGYKVLTARDGQERVRQMALSLEGLVFAAAAVWLWRRKFLRIIRGRSGAFRELFHVVQEGEEKWDWLEGDKKKEGMERIGKQEGNLKIEAPFLFFCGNGFSQRWIFPWAFPV